MTCGVEACPSNMSFPEQAKPLTEGVKRPPLSQWRGRGTGKSQEKLPELFTDAKESACVFYSVLV